MFAYFPHFLPTSIVVIGAGGTGSRLLPPLTQLVKTCLRRFNPAAMLDKCDIYVIDGDIVEQKNLSRQNFITPDVGRNKALVVAERYARGFGINVIPCTEFLGPDTKTKFDGPAGEISFKTIFENAVVIFAVDSAKARREILSFMNIYCTSNLFLIDAGNEDDFGQIKLSTGHVLINNNGDSKRTLEGLPKDIPSEYTTSMIPFDFKYYRELGDSAAERSCADLPQTLAINTMMSTLILCTLQNFLQLRPIKYDGQSFSLTGGVSTTWNTPRNWAQRIVPWESRTGDVSAFLRGTRDSLRHAGTAMTKAGDENGDIFFHLRQQCVTDYKASGMILERDGSLRDANPPPPPPPAPKLAEKLVVPEAVPEAPMLRPMATPAEIPAAAEVTLPMQPPMAAAVRPMQRRRRTPLSAMTPTTPEPDTDSPF